MRYPRNPHTSRSGERTPASEEQLCLEKPLITDIVTSLLAVVLSVLSFVTVSRSPAVAFGLHRGVVIGSAFLLGSLLPWAIPRVLGRSSVRLLRWVRLFYVQVYYLFFFAESIHLSYLIYRGRTLDRFFANLDQSIFGFQPALELYRALPNSRPIVELFFFGYGFYFLLFSIGVWLLFFRGRERDAYRFLSVVTVGFYALYLFYCVFPVAGPKYYFPELRAQWYEPFNGYFFTDALKRSFGSLDLYGAAFPSSHAAISTVSLLLNFRYQRTVGWICLLPTLLLYVSTVYIYAHYAVDTIVGIAIGICYFIVLPRLIERAEDLVEGAQSKIRSRLATRQ